METVLDTPVHDSWTINKGREKGTDEKFLGVLWTSEGPQVLDTILHKILNISAPRDKTQVQHLIGTFANWRDHIPYLQIIIKPLYRAIRKATGFQRREE